MNNFDNLQKVFKKLKPKVKLGKCNKCGWEICCIKDFEQHIIEKWEDHKTL